MVGEPLPIRLERLVLLYLKLKLPRLLPSMIFAVSAKDIFFAASATQAAMGFV